MTQRLRKLANRLALGAVLMVLAGWADLAGAQSPFRPAGPEFPVPRRLPAPTVSSGLRSDTVFVPLSPAYPAPAGTFVPLPAGGSPPPPRPLDERDRVHAPGREPVWVPGRFEVVTGIDDTGRVTHALRYAPGRFDTNHVER